VARSSQVETYFTADDSYMTDEVIASLKALKAAEAECRRCPLYRNATQVVPGEGPVRARIMLVGEQPGDREDIAGKPFVGRLGVFWMKRWPMRDSAATSCSLQMPSNTSSSSRGARDACTSVQTSTKSSAATIGSSTSALSSNRK
jgi:hypothetical protein